MKKILVVVDMQNDFIDGPLGTPEAVGIVDKVCAKIREGEWDAVYATKDTHGYGYFNTQEGKKLPIKHCVSGTDGHKFNFRVQEVSETGDWLYHYVIKNTFGSPLLVDYINVWTNDFSGSDIELTLIGVCTDICVISNALLLKAHYPEMKIVVDAACCAGTTPEKHRMALEVMKSCQVDVVNMPVSEFNQIFDAI